MDVEKIIKLMQEFSNSNLSLFEYEEGNIRIKFRNKSDGNINKNTNNNGKGFLQFESDYQEANQTLEQFSNEPSKVVISEEKKDNLIIKSPTVGTYYSASSPESEPFIQVGDVIEKGQIIGIVEAMKVMNEIESPYTAVVEEITVEDGEVVEFGQVLVVLESV